MAECVIFSVAIALPSYKLIPGLLFPGDLHMVSRGTLSLSVSSTHLCSELTMFRPFMIL